MNVNTHKKSLIYIGIALLLTLSLMSVQFVAAIYSNSLALFADGSHLLVHNSSLIIAVVTSIISFKTVKNNATKAALFDILGGTINCILFMFISIGIFAESFYRLHGHSDLEVNSKTMLAVSIFGLFIHILSAFILNKGRQHSFNVHALFLHSFFDCLSTLLTLMGSLLMIFTDYPHIDSIISIFIAVMIMLFAVRLLNKCFIRYIKLKESITLNKEIQSSLLKNFKEIRNIHNSELNINDSGTTYSAHIKLASNKSDEEIISDIKSILKSNFDIKDTIIQIEYN